MDSDITSTFGALVRTGDGTLSAVHPQHGEKYHSDAGAGLEADDLFIRGSGIDPRKPARVLDVGLGLGYNAFALIREWLLCSDAANLTLTSLEINPELASTVQAMPPWIVEWLPSPVVALYAQAREISCSELDTAHLVSLRHPVSGGKLAWRVLVGDGATTTLPDDFTHIFQDAFSPPVNPELWTIEWFTRLKKHSRGGCVLVTYSVARSVRDALAIGGWSSEKIPTTTAKKSWLRAIAVPAEETVSKERCDGAYN
jgi:tRNA U34 5-methylaminomethyl-2-thiouridine-forming methyltransferase MnmC